MLGSLGCTAPADRQLEIQAEGLSVSFVSICSADIQTFGTGAGVAAVVFKYESNMLDQLETWRTSVDQALAPVEQLVRNRDASPQTQFLKGALRNLGDRLDALKEAGDSAHSALIRQPDLTPKSNVDVSWREHRYTAQTLVEMYLSVKTVHLAEIEFLLAGAPHSTGRLWDDIRTDAVDNAIKSACELVDQQRRRLFRDDPDNSASSPSASK